jgi:hypothetical protein
MGTDRTTLYSKPCPCGQGQVTVDHCSPDHSWPTGSEWYEKQLRCDACKEEYVLKEYRRHFFLESRQKHEADENMREQIQAAEREFMATSEIKRMLVEFQSMLDGVKSNASRWRILRQYGMTYSAQATFSKQWRGADHWIASHVISPNDIVKVHDMLDGRYPKVAEGLEQLEAFRTEASKSFSIPDPENAFFVDR